MITKLDKQQEVHDLISRLSALQLYEKFKSCNIYGNTTHDNMKHMQHTLQAIEGFDTPHAFIESSRQSYMTTALAFAIVHDLLSPYHQYQTDAVLACNLHMATEIKNMVWRILNAISEYCEYEMKNDFSIDQRQIRNLHNNNTVIFLSTKTPNTLRGMTISKLYFDNPKFCVMSDAEQQQFINAIMPPLCAMRSKIVSISTGSNPNGDNFLTHALRQLSYVQLHFNIFDMPYYSEQFVSTRIQSMGRERFNAEYLLV